MERAFPLEHQLKPRPQQLQHQLVDFLLELLQVSLLPHQLPQVFRLEAPLPLERRDPQVSLSVALQPRHLQWVLLHQIRQPLHPLLQPPVHHHLDLAEHQQYLSLLQLLLGIRAHSHLEHLALKQQQPQLQLQMSP